MNAYFENLANRFGQAWNDFWFRPSDPYPTSLLRIVVGLVATWWLASFTFDLQRLLGPSGWLSVAGVQNWRGNRGVSLLDYANTATELWLLHAAALLAVALLTIGLWTRISSIAATVLVLSHIWRSPMVSGELEDILAFFMVYLCLAPSGAYLSVDAWMARRKGKPPLAFSMLATLSLRLMQVHLSAIYFMMALAKCRGAVWWNGEGVWWMAARPESRLIDLSWLSAYPDLVAAWTHGIVIFEFVYAILIWNRWARPLLIGLSVLHWIGLALLTGSLGFCLLMLAGNLAFIPASALRSCCGRNPSNVGEPVSLAA